MARDLEEPGAKQCTVPEVTSSLVNRKHHFLGQVFGDAQFVPSLRLESIKVAISFFPCPLGERPISAASSVEGLQQDSLDPIQAIPFLICELN